MKRYHSYMELPDLAEGQSRCGFAEEIHQAKISPGNKVISHCSLKLKPLYLRYTRVFSIQAEARLQPRLEVEYRDGL